MTVYDNPNQQVVRPDGSGPGAGDEPAPKKAAAKTPPAKKKDDDK